ncbi:MAG: HEPN domain-containing protein [Elusimicrobia bacterium]|nr:HEPN domain-containing protein [Elusimicrobiota bacterium]
MVKELLAGGYLKVHPSDEGQAKKLLLRAARDIKTARANIPIDEEAAYTFAYLAMLRSGRALLFLKGYRPADGRQHKTIVEAAGFFLGPKFTDLADCFDMMRRKRNQFTYEPDLPLSASEVKQALASAESFVGEIRRFIKGDYPELDLG